MSNVLRLPYTEIRTGIGQPILRPLLPIQLSDRGQVIQVTCLLDTGADINLIPYSVGLSLGLRWEAQPAVAGLSGNLNAAQARGVALQAVIGDVSPVRLAFAWLQTDQVPLILGQTNFFDLFDVCFFRVKRIFEVRPA